MEPYLACRVCLTTDLKLHTMDKYQLKPTYDEIFANSLQESQLDHLPHNICVFCATSLSKFAAFRARCEQAKQLMEYLLVNSSQISTEQTDKINTIKWNLSLPYTIQVIHNIDFTVPAEVKTESTKYEENYAYLNEINGQSKEFVDIHGKVQKNTDELMTDFEDLNDVQNDSDDEPLSLKVTKKKVKKKAKVESSEYELVFLTKEEQINEVLARKETDNYKNLMYKCNCCYRGFMTESTYRNHMVIHDPATGAESCYACGKRCTDARQLRAHVHLTHARVYTCRRCGHRAKSHHKAREHAQWHSGHVYSCAHCPLSFAKSTTYLTHLRVRHSAGRATCRMCGLTFLGEQGLNLHYKKAHRRPQVTSSNVYVRCKSCDAGFVSDTALKRHKRQAIDDECDTTLSWCSHCGESFSCEQLLKTHIEGHQKGNSHTCAKCARPFASERSLAMHTARLHGSRQSTTRLNNWICETCGYTCHSRASLVSHQRRHTGEKPYECPLCHKRFGVRQRLQIHVRTHTGERPYACAACPKTFVHKAALNRHARVHSGARPYRCGACGKGFSQSNSMKKHAAAVHQLRTALRPPTPNLLL